MNIRARFVYHYKSNTISSKNSLSIIARTTQRKYQSTLYRHYKKHRDMQPYPSVIARSTATCYRIPPVIARSTATCYRTPPVIARSTATCYRTSPMSLREAPRRAIVPHSCHCEKHRDVLSYLTHVIARSTATCYRTSPMSLRRASRRGNLIKQHSTAKRYYLHFYIQKTAIRIAVFWLFPLIYIIFTHSYIPIQ